MLMVMHRDAIQTYIEKTRVRGMNIGHRVINIALNPWSKSPLSSIPNTKAVIYAPTPYIASPFRARAIISFGVIVIVYSYLLPQLGSTDSVSPSMGR